jgi:hypothetical protein
MFPFSILDTGTALSEYKPTPRLSISRSSKLNIITQGTNNIMTFYFNTIFWSAQSESDHHQQQTLGPLPCTKRCLKCTNNSIQIIILLRNKKSLFGSMVFHGITANLQAVHNTHINTLIVILLYNSLCFVAFYLQPQSTMVLVVITNVIQSPKTIIP